MEALQQVMKDELVKVYIEAYGKQAWDRQSEEEKAHTLHDLL